MASVDQGSDALPVASDVPMEDPVGVSDALVNEDQNEPSASAIEHVEAQKPSLEDSARNAEVSGNGAGEGAMSTEGDVAQAVDLNHKDSSEAVVDEREGLQADSADAPDHLLVEEGNDDADPNDAAHDQEEHEEPGDGAYAGDEHHDEGEGTDDDDDRYHHHGQGDDDHDDVMHNDDEYDPANPTHAGDGGDAYNPEEHPDSTEHADDEYDPANPNEGFADGGDKKNDQASSPPHKRKLSDTPTAGPAPSPGAPSASARSAKRSRSTVDQKVDKRGLKDSAWDRLMDFESNGEFRVAQVSRAAFASIAQLPEFAQCAIIARFTRTPMKDVRDKNELMLRLHGEYIGENPHVSSLQPVSVFIDVTSTDPGLFEYGYAPPLPSSGMSSVKVPFRQDKRGTISTPSAPSALPQKLPKATPEKPQLDEFGREIKPKGTPSTPSREQPTAAIAPATQPSTIAPIGKPSDPRRRRPGGPDGVPTADSRRPIEKSEVYNRLPVSVKSRLDALIAARRLPEAINDNVLSRLNHLPESTAVTAIEKFTESDLGQVGNINGFLVGIINRVQDRGPSSNDPRGNIPATCNAPSNAPSTSYHQQQQPPHQPQQHFSQHAPAIQHGYSGSSTAPGGQAPSYDHAPGNHFSGIHTQPPTTAPPVGYAVNHTPQHPQGYAPNPQPAWNQTQAAPPTSHPGPGGRFSSHPTIDQAVALLPVSIQNHLVSLVNSRILPSLDDLSEKCYEVLGQLSEALANDVLKRFGTANLSSVRNRSAFLMGVVKKCRQEYGFD